MNSLDDNELNEFITLFENKIGDGKINIDELKNYMKLVELPFECQINKDDKEETFNNLYCWYKCKGDDDMIARMPEPYYSDYINSIVNDLCE